MAVVQAFAEHHLTLYLQARNPNVPGVVNKLRAPSARQLTAAHKFWRLARIEFGKSGRRERFQDIYSERLLGDAFTIDHFLPWSFVAHDQLWNLAPVEGTTNSSKNDILPDLDLYLPRLARLHFDAIQAASRHPKMLEDYTDCFKLDTAGLLALGESGLTAKYREVMAPQSQIAINLGFQSGWRMERGQRRRYPIAPARGGTRAGHAQYLSSMSQVPTEIIIEPINTDEAHGRRPNRLPFYSLKVAAGGFVGGRCTGSRGLGGRRQAWVLETAHRRNVRHQGRRPINGTDHHGRGILRVPTSCGGQPPGTDPPGAETRLLRSRDGRKLHGQALSQHQDPGR